ncbi:hypothetical protein C3941_19475 [Kaistia algarum]|uniref:hypothetical protein n=1 Tax=Kaistia algarum TaxID=2083279 RepID=UPI000CE88A60|nr:hypothetical protein [Kaistia algarum]MCX5516173.1 hypothetical protein [Kaistia algarum]PPE78248.1 hypothetical protein C3941_19475 [Kaistia algarum]
MTAVEPGPAPLFDRLRALAKIHDDFAARNTWKGNAKYSPPSSAEESRRHHEQAAADLRSAADLLEPWMTP